MVDAHSRNTDPGTSRARGDGPSAAVRIRVMKRDRFRCTYCGAPGTDVELEIDHIIAVARGGSHHISNLTTACRNCNQTKGAGDAPAARDAPSFRHAVGTRRPGISILEVMICWTADNGHIALVEWPDEKRKSDRYSCTTGACESRIHRYSKIELQHFVLSTAMGILLEEGMSTAEVHRTLWPLIEYRDALPPDVKAPEDNHKYGDVADPFFNGEWR